MVVNWPIVFFLPSVPILFLAGFLRLLLLDHTFSVTVPQLSQYAIMFSYSFVLVSLVLFVMSILCRISMFFHTEGGNQQFPGHI